MPLPLSVAKAFKSLKVKAEASQIGGGAGSAIVGHCALADNAAQKKTKIKVTAFTVSPNKRFVFIIG